MNKRIGYWLVLLLFPLGVFSQQESIAPIKLDWEYFKNDKPKNVGHDAFLAYNLKYKYRPTKVKGERIFLQFEVIATLDTAKSYFDFNRKFKDERLLAHEQGHADILIIYARKLKKALDEGIFLKTNYRLKTKELFDVIFSEMNSENEKYDLETNHSRNRAIQDTWNLYFKTELIDEP